MVKISVVARLPSAADGIWLTTYFRVLFASNARWLAIRLARGARLFVTPIARWGTNRDYGMRDARIRMRTA